jgi:hypothetical protein
MPFGDKKDLKKDWVLNAGAFEFTRTVLSPIVSKKGDVSAYIAFPNGIILRLTRLIYIYRKVLRWSLRPKNRLFF